MRLIDGDALKEAVSKHPLIDFTDDDIFKLIDNAPRLVPEPIKLYQKHALALVDDLREKGVINDHEMGILRRAIIGRT